MTEQKKELDDCRVQVEHLQQRLDYYIQQNSQLLQELSNIRSFKVIGSSYFYKAMQVYIKLKNMPVIGGFLGIIRKAVKSVFRR